LRIGLAVAALLCTALAARGATPITPGLWEESVSVKTDNAQANAAMAQMQDKLAAMSPDQRKMVEQMMASHGIGAAPGGGGAGGSANTHAIRVCLTREQLERDAMPSDDGRCSRRNMTRSGNTMKFSFTCENPRGTVSGDGLFTATSASSFTVATDADIVREGKTSHMHSDVAGKFVSSDCGDVKPIQPR